MSVDPFLKRFIESEYTDFMGVNNLGILRKDLIASLGFDRAKGFLLRYGYHCGSNDAKYIEENLPFECDSDIIEVGYKINDVKGYSKLETIKVIADRQKGEFHFEGNAYYSYEAEHHITNFGFHNEPVCYNLCGWASGYVSKYLGEEVIFKEIECIGKGDSHCKYIAKPIKEWGDEINDLLTLYKEENLVSELDRAYNRIEKQKKMLSDVIEMNEKLSQILIKGGDISNILKVLSRNLSSTVILEDRNFNIIEVCGHYMPYNLMDLVDTYKFKKNPVWIKQLFKEKRTVQFSVSNQFNGWQHERLISPVLVNNDVWGYISFIKQDASFDEIEYLLLERSNTICALHFANERTSIETEKRIIGGFFNELLTPNPDIKSLSYRMKIMGFDFEKGHYIYNISFYNESIQNENEVNSKHEIIDYINNYLQPFVKNNIIISTYLDRIILLVSEDLIRNLKTDSKSFGEQLVTIISNKVKASVNIGISSLFKGLHHFQKSFSESNKAIQIANRKESITNVISFNEMGYLGFLLESNNISDLEKFAVNLLDCLMRYDKEGNGELLKTLYFLLEFQGSITQTSSKMMISEGAVRYRLKRIGEIANINLNDTKDFVNTHLALQILLLFGIWELK